MPRPAPPISAYGASAAVNPGACRFSQAANVDPHARFNSATHTFRPFGIASNGHLAGDCAYACASAPVAIAYRFRSVSRFPRDSSFYTKYPMRYGTPSDQLLRPL